MIMTTLEIREYPSLEKLLEDKLKVKSDLRDQITDEESETKLTGFLVL